MKSISITIAKFHFEQKSFESYAMLYSQKFIVTIPVSKPLIETAFKAG